MGRGMRGVMLKFGREWWNDFIVSWSVAVVVGVLDGVLEGGRTCGFMNIEVLLDIVGGWMR